MRRMAVSVAGTEAAPCLTNTPYKLMTTKGTDGNYLLRGEADGTLNLTDSTLRTLVINDRAGLYK